jgi:RNA polymerase sigma factor (TIGR02999 family)
MNQVTGILSAIKEGDSLAAERLLPLVYEELRKLAASRLAREKPGQTLQATALVHDAYLRLVGGGEPRSWNSRGHFFAAAAEAMRRILVEAARRRRSLRRGGGRTRRDLLDDDLLTYGLNDEILDLDAALTKLGAVDAPAAELVKLRAFAGMTFEEAAEHLGVSPSTAKRSWAYARAWLAREMDARPSPVDDSRRVS